MDPIFIPILIPLGAFAMVFGLRYLSNKERMAMIERGMVPTEPQRRRASRPLQSLKWGLIVCAVGLGLLTALFLTNLFMTPVEERSAIYFGLIAIFGGLALIISYTFEKRHEEKEKQNQPR